MFTFSGHAGTQAGLEATVATGVASSRVDNAVLATLTDVRRMLGQTATEELLHSVKTLTVITTTATVT